MNSKKKSTIFTNQVTDTACDCELKTHEIDFKLWIHKNKNTKTATASNQKNWKLFIRLGILFIYHRNSPDSGTPWTTI